MIDSPFLREISDITFNIAVFTALLSTFLKLVVLIGKIFGFDDAN